MKWLLVLALFAGLLVVPSAEATFCDGTAAECGEPAPPIAAVYVVRDCGNYGDHGDGEVYWDKSPVQGAGIFNLRTRDVGCRKARRMALHGLTPARCNDDYTECQVGSFKCAS